MTPQEKCDLVKANSGDLWLRMAKKANELAIPKGNFDKRMLQMYEVIDALADAVGKQALCKQGCNHCCYQSVLIPKWEARRIANFTGLKMNNIAGYGHDGDTPEELRDRHAGTPCPFLQESGCTIYPVRPFNCRLHYNMGDDSALCDILGHLGAEVPYFNFEDLKNFLAMMFMQHSMIFGDIREFFNWEEKC